ncbi:MAG: RNA-binding cell elongation regulator Jag/EloR [Candidatus Muiribacteriota bacterium]
MKLTCEGKTIEDAKKEAMKKLGIVDEEQINFTILETDSKGIFGFGTKNAVVEAQIKKPHVYYAKKYLTELLNKWNLSNYDIELNDKGKEINLNIIVPIEVKRRLIGKFGRTLNALEYLVRIYVNNNLTTEERQNKINLYIDVENYRMDKLRKIEKLAGNLAEKVIISGKDIEMKPMSSRERKAVHMSFKNDPHIATYSKGTEPHRKIILSTKKK